ncbi:MAG: alpha/beta fold hydrolase [Maricaulaceae bacterium]
MKGKFFLFFFTAIGSIVFYAIGSRLPLPSAKAATAYGTQYSAPSPAGSVTYNLSGESDPVVVMLASAGREVSDFNNLAQSVAAKGYRVLTVEAPGINGSSMVETPNLEKLSAEVHAAITHAGFEDEALVLVGHAFGNRVSRTYTHYYPANIEGIVLLAAGGQKPVEETAAKALMNCFNPLSAYLERLRDIRYAFFYDGNEVPKNWRRGWHTRTAMLHGETVRNTTDTSWQAAGGKTPMLIVQPSHDRMAPKKDTSDILKARYPNRVTVILAENAGHALLPERPELVERSVLGFLKEHHPSE